MRNDVPQLMQAMDVFLLPSHFEGLPVVGIEAQAAGLPSFFSNTITKEVGVTNLAHFISLEEEPKKWADIVVNFLILIDKAGYQICKMPVMILIVQLKKLKNYIFITNI